ncbi:hypothetical protein SAMN05421819_3385 [Bryocella elongata]|uniref:Uncharacterized protein n=1 Tax=Bryocella elongata TaxID=863522 RepID=A0A1H6B0Q0_9BACT|nr:hypothetical protein SAMN05421819_3385 [Bryocella elongata]
MRLHEFSAANGVRKTLRGQGGEDASVRCQRDDRRKATGTPRRSAGTGIRISEDSEVPFSMQSAWGLLVEIRTPKAYPRRVSKDVEPAQPFSVRIRYPTAQMRVPHISILRCGFAGSRSCRQLLVFRRLRYARGLGIMCRHCRHLLAMLADVVRSDVGIELADAGKSHVTHRGVAELRC